MTKIIISSDKTTFLRRPSDLDLLTNKSDKMVWAVEIKLWQTDAVPKCLEPHKKTKRGI